MTRRSPEGFSLIELIVVLGVVTVVLSLLLSALGAGREAARRTQCMNNLKQIHLALQSYHSWHEVYPPGVVDDAGPFAEAGSQGRPGWPSMLLLYAEQRFVYQTVNFDVGGADPQNSTARYCNISMLFCPDSRPGEAWPDTIYQSLSPFASIPVGPGFGRTSYAGCHNDVEKAIDVDDHGVFYLNSSVRADDVFDGLSQTIFVGEVLAPESSGWLSGGRNSLRNTGAPINGLDVAALGDVAKSEAWRNSDGTPAALERLTAEGAVRPPPGYVGGFGSRHRGDGAIFAFGDGSVRFIRSSIDPAVYRRLGHRDDGEEISGDAY